MRNTLGAPESAQERPRAPGKLVVRALKNLQSGLQQRHSCELWGTPLRAGGTVADLKGLSVQIHAKFKVFEGFRHAHAHVARMVLFDMGFVHRISSTCARERPA